MRAYIHQKNATQININHTLEELEKKTEEWVDVSQSDDSEGKHSFILASGSNTHSLKENREENKEELQEFNDIRDTTASPDWTKLDTPEEISAKNKPDSKRKNLFKNSFVEAQEKLMGVQDNNGNIVLPILGPGMGVTQFTSRNSITSRKPTSPSAQKKSLAEERSFLTQTGKDIAHALLNIRQPNIVVKTSPGIATTSYAFGEESRFDNIRHIDEMSDDEIKQVEMKIKQDISTSYDTKKQLEQFAHNPKANCANAAEILVSHLERQGYRTSIIGVEMYKTPLDIAPLNHYAVIATKESQQSIMIDVTFNQFKAHPNHQMLITSLEEWSRNMREADVLKNQLILAKEFNNLQQAKTAINLPSGENFLESHLMLDSDSLILHYPKWFQDKTESLIKADLDSLNNKTLSKMADIDKKINNVRNKLNQLRKKEAKLTEELKDIPCQLEDKIKKLERYIEELESFKRAPDRLNGYRELNTKTTGKFESVDINYFFKT